MEALDKVFHVTMVGNSFLVLRQKLNKTPQCFDQ